MEQQDLHGHLLALYGHSGHKLRTGRDVIRTDGVSGVCRCLHGSCARHRHHAHCLRHSCPLQKGLRENLQDSPCSRLRLWLAQSFNLLFSAPTNLFVNGEKNHNFFQLILPSLHQSWNQARH